ncbi:MAG: IS1096 element passenger TnpR family protein [Flavobacteriales bacterium]
MAAILKLRVILDTEEDIFRDIEIDMQAPLEHLHLATLDAFEWNDAREMASFYKSNEAWDRGDEIPLMSMSPELPSMESSTVDELLPDLAARGVYVYDYLRMWCFYLEPLAIAESESGVSYPRLTLEFGKAPDPNSRQPEGLDDLALLAEEVEQAKSGASQDADYSTGDPELDAYLQGDDDDDDAKSDERMDNIDDYDDLF